MSYTLSLITIAINFISVSLTGLAPSSMQQAFTSNNTLKKDPILAIRKITLIFTTSMSKHYLLLNIIIRYVNTHKNKIKLINSI